MEHTNNLLREWTESAIAWREQRDHPYDSQRPMNFPAEMLVVSGRKP